MIMLTTSYSEEQERLRKIVSVNADASAEAHRMYVNDVNIGLILSACSLQSIGAYFSQCAIESRLELLGIEIDDEF